ncbi:MAG TPA: hypothetical protein VGQ68_06500 [Gaiellaceae bacterium]|nr:hypothetical protein [Gaiellaceae bacterium]
MDVTAKAARTLARRSSRRQFFKLLGAGSLGTGLWLTRTGVSLGAAVGGCSGCGGGPCNPCGSPHPLCANLPNRPCKPCQLAGGCPVGCSTSGEWFCCLNGTVCRQRCSECSCPEGCCHCFTRINIPCVPRPHSGDQPCTCPPDAVPVAA